MDIFTSLPFWLLLGVLGSFTFMAYYFFKGQELIRHGVRVDATVTDYWTEEYDSGDPEDVGATTDYYLKVFFTDEEKFVHNIKIKVFHSTYKKGKSSMSIKLVHPAGKPEKARPDQRLAIHRSTIIWGVILVAFVAAYTWVSIKEPNLF